MRMYIYIYIYIYIHTLVTNIINNNNNNTNHNNDDNNDDNDIKALCSTSSSSARARVTRAPGRACIYTRHMYST